MADKPPGGFIHHRVEPPKREKVSLEEKIKAVKTFLESDTDARNKLKTEHILGIDPGQARRLKKQLDDDAERIMKEHEDGRQGPLSADQELDFLLEDFIAWVTHYNDRDPKHNFQWLGENGDGFLVPELVDKKYKMDDAGVLPQTDKTPPLVFAINATVGEAKAPVRKLWGTLYDLVGTGTFGIVPMSLKIHNMPTAQAAGLLNLPRFTFAASRDQVKQLMDEALKLKHVKELKEEHDPKDVLLFTNLPDKEKSFEEWAARERVKNRLRTIESIEQGIRMHDLQLQFAVQLVAQCKFYRDFAAIHRRRVMRAIHKERTGEELSEDDRLSYEHFNDKESFSYDPVKYARLAGRAWKQKQEDETWGMCGLTLPTKLDDTLQTDGSTKEIGLCTLRDNLGETVERLGNYIYASEQMYAELIKKLYTAELEQAKDVRKRYKFFARTGSLKGLRSAAPAHLALMRLLSVPELYKDISHLDHKALGYERPPKTKLH